jgi:hypothetical protein
MKERKKNGGRTVRSGRVKVVSRFRRVRGREGEGGGSGGQSSLRKLDSGPSKHGGEDEDWGRGRTGGLAPLGYRRRREVNRINRRVDPGNC